MLNYIFHQIFWTLTSFFIFFCVMNSIFKKIKKQKDDRDIQFSKLNEKIFEINQKNRGMKEEIFNIKNVQIPLKQNAFLENNIEEILKKNADILKKFEKEFDFGSKKEVTPINQEDLIKLVDKLLKKRLN